MTKEEGEKAGVENHRLYFRTYNDKANLAPPADKSDWFKLESVDLGNGPGWFGASFTAGDSVGVVTQWKWPDPLAGVTGPTSTRSPPRSGGGEWRKNVQAKAWVGYAVAKALELDLDQQGRQGQGCRDDQGVARLQARWSWSRGRTKTGR